MKIKYQNYKTGFLVCWVFFLSACGGGEGDATNGLAAGGNNVRQGSYEVVTLAGTGAAGFVDGPGSTAQFSYPTSLTVDGAGNVFVADEGNNVVRKIAPDGAVMTFAGQPGVNAYQDGSGSAAIFSDLIKGIAADPLGNLFVSDSNNKRIRKITPAGAVTTFAGSWYWDIVNGPIDQAQFNDTRGLAFDSKGNLYVTEVARHLVRKIGADGIVSTLAGDGSAGYVDCYPGSCARFNQPESIAVDSKDNLYVSESGNHMIRKITPAGAVSTFAGSGLAGFQDGAANLARFNSPVGVVVDSNDNVYVADQNNRVIRRITQYGVVSTAVGRPNYKGNQNGLGTQASFGLPSGLAIDKNDNLYVVDYLNHNVRKLVLK